MDNYQNKGKTITIKINGNDRPFKENTQPKTAEVQGETEETINPSRNHAQSEYINRAESEIAAAQEDDSFDWILPEGGVSNEIKEYKIASYSPKGKKKKGFTGLKGTPKNKQGKGIITSVFFAVFFAVLLGTSFGFIMLKLVITDHSVETAAPVELEEQETKKEEPKKSKGTANLKIAPIKTYVIQAGVFSNEGAANSVQASISQKGIPTRVITTDGKAYLFVGVADSIENAKSLGGKIKGNGIDVYAKEIKLGGGDLSKLANADKKLIEMAPELFSTLTASSSSASLSNSVSPELVDKLNKQGEEIKKIDFKQLQNKKTQQLKVDLESSIDSVNQFQKTQDVKYINKMQETLLSFLAVYQSL